MKLRHGVGKGGPSPTVLVSSCVVVALTIVYLFVNFTIGWQSCPSLPATQQNGSASKSSKLVTEATVRVIGKEAGTDKAHNYPQMYTDVVNYFGLERRLDIMEFGFGCDYIKIPATGLEVVTRGGGSGRFWRKIMPIRPHTTVMEFNCNCAKHCNKDVDEAICGDQNDQSNISKLGMYDLVVDDAEHSSVSMYNMLTWMLPHVKAGGLLIIEDIAACREKEYANRKENFCDVVGRFARCAVHDPHAVCTDFDMSAVRSVSFYNGAMVIKKL